MSQTSRVAIVTGAARGIGAETARRLAADGNAVAALDLADATETAESITATAGTAIAVKCDVSDEEQVSSAVTQVTEQLGAPTVLVNNAGVIRDNMLFKMSVSDWDTVMQVHLRGAFLMSRAVQPHMREAGWGRIVNLSSTSAQGNRGQANYATAKAGLQGLTKTLAIELGKYGITTNAVAPGTTETDMLKATAERIGVDFQDFTAAAAEQIPVQRTGKPGDIAATISFLARDDAGFVNGQVIYVAGGPKD